MKLIATQAFGPYALGASITDAGEIATILAGEQAAFVVKVPDDPVPASSKGTASDSATS